MGDRVFPTPINGGISCERSESASSHVVRVVQLLFAALSLRPRHQQSPATRALCHQSLMLLPLPLLSVLGRGPRHYVGCTDTRRMPANTLAPICQPMRRSDAAD